MKINREEGRQADNNCNNFYLKNNNKLQKQNNKT
jgi:hypothetical protein